MNEPRINPIPLTSEVAGFSANKSELVITREQIFALEKEIPVRDLYDAVLKIEAKLKARAKEQGYKVWDDDLSESAPKYPDEFAHILEHAILAVIDNNLSSSGVLSTGKTFNRGFEEREDPIYAYSTPNSRISHGHEIRLSFSPSIPKKFHQEYADQIIREIKDQYLQANVVDLEAITLR